ncbi:MAG: hypothetical protein RM049_10700 [Nostoc sp. DedQUE04]|uniref:hypothetical protein n=1 Tax=Nostoc sp. DedQUE04 TaxID=3075390 RepID=UPI002AD535E0|nr:hypothetical protein [Nostoc sp. DedQUE04]MDZ8135755.1 hypothetical protein [Nostoc sp. DedQUE04]
MKSTERPSKTPEKQEPKLNGQISKFSPIPADDKLPEELTTDQKPGIPLSRKNP